MARKRKSAQKRPVRSSRGRRVGLGIGAAAAALAAGTALGVYAFSGKRGAKNRRKVKAWAAKARRDVLKETAKLKKIGATEYAGAVDRVVARYKKAKQADPRELIAFARELKDEWKRLERRLDQASTKKRSPKRKKRR